MLGARAEYSYALEENKKMQTAGEKWKQEQHSSIGSWKMQKEQKQNLWLLMEQKWTNMIQKPVHWKRSSEV